MRDSFAGTLFFSKEGKAFPKVVTEAVNYRLNLTLNASLDQDAAEQNSAQ